MTPVLVWDLPACLFHFAFGMVTGRKEGKRKDDDDD